MLLSALGLCLCVLSGAPPAGPGPACPAWTGAAGIRQMARAEQELARGVNALRAERHVGPLVVDDRLTRVARAYAAMLVQMGELNHTGPDGRKVADRLRDAKILDWNAAGENLASGSVYDHLVIDENNERVGAVCRDAAEVAAVLVNGWVNSPGHLANMVRPEYTHIGSGAAYAFGGELLYAVHVFAARITCGFAGAGCCVAPDGVGVMCQQGLRCVDRRCEK